MWYNWGMSNKVVSIQVRVTPDEKAAIKSAAQRNRDTMSAYIRRVVLAEVMR